MDYWSAWWNQVARHQLLIACLMCIRTLRASQVKGVHNLFNSFREQHSLIETNEDPASFLVVYSLVSKGLLIVFLLDCSKRIK